MQRRGGCSRAFKRNHVVQVGVSVRRQTGHLLRALCSPLAKKAGIWSCPEADRGRVSTIASTATVPRWRPSPPPTKCRVTPEPGDAKNASLRCVEFRGKAVRGRSSVVERQLPKLNVVGSIPIARSNFPLKLSLSWLPAARLAFPAPVQSSLLASQCYSRLRDPIPIAPRKSRRLRGKHDLPIRESCPASRSDAGFTIGDLQPKLRTSDWRTIEHHQREWLAAH